MLARVSNLESFRRWREDEDSTVEDFLHQLLDFEPTTAMQAGTAFHKALETARPGEYEQLSAMGHTFLLSEGTLVLPEIRELRGFKRYGDLTVTGCVDILDGKRIDDHKSTGRFDPERYLAGYQWRIYLDIFEADHFRWNVFEVRNTKGLIYEVADPQTLEVYRYPELEQDCARLAADFYAFMREQHPQYNALKEAA
jgi:hypothetical protein